MARRVLKRYQVEAVFQTKRNTIHELEMELDAENGQQVWDALQEMGKAESEHLIRAKVREVNAGTGEYVTVRPKEDQQGTLYLPPPGDEPKGTVVPEKRTWFETAAFVATSVDVWPCMYKAEEDNDTVT